MKKYIIKNVIIISLILAFAMVVTYKIYYKFKNERNTDYSSFSLDITYHEKSGNKISLTKSVPVLDSIGLSSTAYTLTVKNNLTVPVNYKLKLTRDESAIETDGCEDYQIPKEVIKIAVKEDKKPVEFYTLDNLDDDILSTKTIKALGSTDYTIRIWVSSSHNLTMNNDLHYHGIIEVEEEKEEE